jgi:hypothetical protein
MFPKLENDIKFKQDLDLFNNALARCPKEYYKTLESLIAQLKSDAKQLDAGHDGFAGGFLDPRTLIDVKSSLTYNRTKIFNLLRKLNLNN